MLEIEEKVKCIPLNYEMDQESLAMRSNELPKEISYSPYPKQVEVAERALEAILRDNSEKIKQCNDFQWYICMPYFKSLSDQNQ